MRWAAVLAIVSCSSNPRRPGYETCGPVSNGDNCVVWLCYETIDGNSVDFWVEYDGRGNEGTFDCDGDRCFGALQKALKEACGNGGGGGNDCRDDCCLICASAGTVPCGNDCIPETETCGVQPGCACTVAESCE